MKSPWKLEKESETIIVIEEKPRRNFLQHICSFALKAGLILIGSAIPLYLLIIPGIKGLVNGELRIPMRRRLSPKMLYGDEAITWSWIHVGLGFLLLLIIWWPMRDIIRNHVANWLVTLVLCLATIACFGIGIYRLASAP